MVLWYDIDVSEEPRSDPTLGAKAVVDDTNVSMNLVCATVSSAKAGMQTAAAVDSLAAFPASAAASANVAAGNKQAVRNWETLVLFAVNLSRLDVMVNMSNVMGNTV